MKRKNILLLCGLLVFAFLLINNCANYSSPTTPDSISGTVKITTNASGGTTYPTPSFTVIWTAPAGLGSEYDMKSIYITIKKGDNILANQNHAGYYYHSSGDTGTNVFSGSDYKYGLLKAILWIEVNENWEYDTDDLSAIGDAITPGSINLTIN